MLVYLHIKRKEMRVIFEDEGIKELLERGKSNRYKKVSKSPKLMQGLRNAYRIMAMVASVEALKGFSHLHYERLKFLNSGKSSVRIVNGSIERLIFRELEDGVVVELIEIDDTHYGNKR